MPLPNRVSEVRAEELVGELLVSQGWDTKRPPQGDLLRQQEYKDHEHLAEIFKGQSKRGGSGYGLPEAILVDRQSLEPIAVVEAKALKSQISVAEHEAKTYAKNCITAGYSPLAVAVAGNTDDGFSVSVFKWKKDRWKSVTYEGQPISWIPNRWDMDRLRPITSPTELRPTPPPPEVLAGYADEINRLLRESGIKDELRPAAVAAIMLALWHSKGEIRRSTSHILQDINQACGQAFWKAEKPTLAASLKIDEANGTLAIKAQRIVAILERLNVTVLTAEHDYLGQLYETFFQYTGGNTIGQYFTPRHIAELMAEIVEVDSEDMVLDPACGTGGFLIASMHRVHKQRKLTREQVVRLVSEKLIGFDHEPVTAALCIANMILRGDGSTGIHSEDVFTSTAFPHGAATVALLNPPFPHKKTDTPSETFLTKALDGLKHGGRVAAIMPTSCLVKKDKVAWRSDLLESHTLEAVIGLPDDLFEPFASSYAGVVIATKGKPHPVDKKIFFARITNDGFEIHKRVKVPRLGEQITEVLDAYRKHKSVAGLCGWSTIDRADKPIFGPGLYVPARDLVGDETAATAMSLIRNRSAFIVGQAPDLCRLERAIAAGRLAPMDYLSQRTPTRTTTAPNTIGGCFNIYWGQKELHSKRGLQPGSALVISSSGENNGCYGFFDFDNVIAPPFVTVPSTGSIGKAHVQEWPCGVTDDCLLLFPKDGVPHEALYVAAAVIRQERWRYSYGMKITPDRIAAYPMRYNDDILRSIAAGLRTAKQLERIALDAAEDIEDLTIARTRLVEDAFVMGQELRAALSRLTD